ncbi:MAG: hypothetical protein ABIX01_11650 [Chitinophagaceae bacterium]
MPHQSLLHDIVTRLQKLVKEHEQLKKENTRLKTDLQIAAQQKAVWLEQERLLKDQVAILQTTGKNMDEAGKKNLEKRINEYIRHIDKAITLLNE